MSDIPRKIKNLRIQNKLTQQQLAKSLNVSQNAVYNWENGKREPNSDTIEKIADIFGVTPSYLMGWQDKDMKIDSEIDYIIERLSGEIEQTEVSKLVQKIQVLASEQNHIENKIKEIDSKYVQKKEKRLDALSDQSEVIELVGKVFDPNAENMLTAYTLLNENGQFAAFERVTELTEIKKYRKYDFDKTDK